MSEGTARLYRPTAIMLLLTVIITAMFAQSGVVGEVYDPEVTDISIPSALIDIPGFVGDVSEAVAEITLGVINAWFVIVGEAGWAAPVVAIPPLMTILLTIVILVDTIPFL